MELYRCLYYVCYTRAENLTLRSARNVSVFVLKFEIKIENQILRIIRAFVCSNIKHYHILRSHHVIFFFAKFIRSSLVDVKMPNWRNSYSIRIFSVTFALRIH